jgi:hypothetical protein
MARVGQLVEELPHRRAGCFEDVNEGEDCVIVGRTPFWILVVTRDALPRTGPNGKFRQFFGINGNVIRRHMMGFGYGSIRIKLSRQ